MEVNPAERIIQWVPKPPAKINREPQASFSAHHNTSQRINPKAGPRPTSSPMSGVLMGGCIGLTGTLATLLGDPPPCPLVRQVRSHKPTSSPVPHDVFITHSPSLFSSGSRRRSLSPSHVYSYLQRIILYHPPSVQASDTRPFVQAEVPLGVETTTHIKEQLQQWHATLSEGAARLAFYYPIPNRPQTGGN
jgi:hypothetical protein